MLVQAKWDMIWELIRNKRKPVGLYRLGPPDSRMAKGQGVRGEEVGFLAPPNVGTLKSQAISK